MKVLHRTVAKDFQWIGVYEDDKEFIATIVVTRNPVGAWEVRVHQPEVCVGGKMLKEVEK
jgi:hypothetical protein